LKPAWVNSSWDPISKKPSHKGAGGVAQVVECLPSKCKALSSNHSTSKKKKKRESERERDLKELSHLFYQVKTQ
jgi:hypothetical protein